MSYVIDKFGSTVFKLRKGKRTEIKMLVSPTKREKPEENFAEQGFSRQMYYSAISQCCDNQPEEGDILMYDGKMLSVVSAMTYYVANEALYRKSLLVQEGESCQKL